MMNSVMEDAALGNKGRRAAYMRFYRSLTSNSSVRGQSPAAARGHREISSGGIRIRIFLC